MSGKLKFAFYWNASCGGCEIAVLDINEKILDVAALADIVLWPVAVDGKYKDIEAMEDGAIDVAFINGAVRNTDNLAMAQLLRRKSKVVVAFGTCAHLGGIPGLANLSRRDEIFERVYSDNAVNPEGTRPKPHTQVPEGELELPEFWNTVYPMGAVVEVDYYLPGCPPTPESIAGAVTAIATGNLPPRGAVLGTGTSTLCHSCPRVKEEKKVKAFQRIAFTAPEPGRCLLEQGIVCLGSVTRDGCGARCVGANMACRGCYGAPDGVTDQGSRFLSILATVVDSNDPQEIKEILSGVVDPVGYAYRFSLPSSLLVRRSQPRTQRVTVEEVAD
ncbi:MAG TPA: oxidoreductase [Symbiobacteriaceae bacterium]|nr:oxidoreductase [Symbiobacteriaceae bacterium]